MITTNAKGDNCMEHTFEWVDAMELLGVMVDSTGSATSAVSHRIAECEKQFFMNKQAFASRFIPIAKRLHAFSLGTTKPLLWCSGGWHLGPALAGKLQAIDMYYARRVIRARWKEEKRTQSTCAIRRKWFLTFKGNLASCRLWS